MMYEFIVYHKKNSYMLSGESADLNDYPAIPVGATVLALNTKEMFLKISDSLYLKLSPANEETSEEIPVEPEAPMEEAETIPEEESVVVEE